MKNKSAKWLEEKLVHQESWDWEESELPASWGSGNEPVRDKLPPMAHAGKQSRGDQQAMRMRSQHGAVPQGTKHRGRS